MSGSRRPVEGLSRRTWTEVADAGLVCRKCGGASQYWDVPVLCRDCRPRRKRHAHDGADL